ncbi:ITPKA [Bugula neritina]|uniref:ITPKA n=1 Tax=Bugula neritina TaxID=10212 RepID=A0A7J7JCB5_BUGNE|nr:ITPKA [Bugula neritina]
MKKLRHHLQKSLERFVDQVQQRKQETESTHKRSRNNKQKRWQSIKRLRSIIDLKDQPEKWVQLAGHQDCFAVGEEGTILKKMIPIERQALEQLMEDRLKPFVPQFRGVVSHESHLISTHTTHNVTIVM